MIKLWLPIPPSVDAAYNNRRGGRYLSKRAKAWRKDAFAAVGDQHQQTRLENKLIQDQYKQGGRFQLHRLAQAYPKLNYHIDYAFTFPYPRTSRPNDVHNFEKLTSDFLTDAHFIIDDLFISSSTFKRTPHSKKEQGVVVTIKTRQVY